MELKAPKGPMFNDASLPLPTQNSIVSSLLTGITYYLLFFLPYPRVVYQLSEQRPQ